MFNLVPFRFDEFDRDFWPDFFRDADGRDLWTGRLAGFKTDIVDDGKEFRIEAELPGFGKDDIKVELNENRLTISAQKDEETENREGRYLRKERRTGQVMRSFILDNVKQDEIKAEFKDGVLKLSLPKQEAETPQVRRIDIN